MKNIILTGATGFVGRHVFAHLAKENVKISVVVREGKEHIFKDSSSVERVISTPNLFIESEEWWINVLQGIDTIIHIAWYAEPGKYLQSEKNWDCLQGTQTLAKAAIRAKVRRFVGIGTCFEYDLSHGMLSVDTPLKPLTPYAGAKAATYMALSQWLPSQSVEFAWCRLFYLYGEGEDKRRLVPYLRSKLSAGEPAELTSGNQIRDFMDVGAAAELVSTISLNHVQGPVNICTGIPVTVKQLAENISDEFGRRDLLKFGARLDNPIDPICVVGIKSV